MRPWPAEASAGTATRVHGAIASREAPTNSAKHATKCRRRSARHAGGAYACARRLVFAHNQRVRAVRALAAAHGKKGSRLPARASLRAARTANTTHLLTFAGPCRFNSPFAPRAGPSHRDVSTLRAFHGRRRVRRRGRAERVGVVSAGRPCTGVPGASYSAGRRRAVPCLHASRISTERVARRTSSCAHSSPSTAGKAMQRRCQRSAWEGRALSTALMRAGVRWCAGSWRRCSGCRLQNSVRDVWVRPGQLAFLRACTAGAQTPFFAAEAPQCRWSDVASASWTTSAPARAALRPWSACCFFQARYSFCMPAPAEAACWRRRYFLQQGYCVVFLHRAKSMQPFEVCLLARVLHDSRL